MGSATSGNRTKTIRDIDWKRWIHQLRRKHPYQISKGIAVELSSSEAHDGAYRALRRVADKFDCDPEDLAMRLQAFFAEIVDEIVSGRPVEIPGFGMFFASAGTLRNGEMSRRCKDPQQRHAMLDFRPHIYSQAELFLRCTVEQCLNSQKAYHYRKVNCPARLLRYLAARGVSPIETEADDEYDVGKKKAKVQQYKKMAKQLEKAKQLEA